MSPDGVTDASAGHGRVGWFRLATQLRPAAVHFGLRDCTRLDQAFDASRG